MFVQFFYTLREQNIPVSPTSFLTLQRALSSGYINTLDDLYTIARTLLIKSEKYFDLYDQVFTHVFEGVELPELGDDVFELIAKSMLEEWLKDPKILADALGINESMLGRMSQDELLEYFKERLKDQHERHDGGSKWIGTGGISPVGHSGYHPGGLRIGGTSRNKSARQIAGERRYRDYSLQARLTYSTMGEALKKLRHLVPQGSKDRLNVDESIYQTMKNAGEIELVFDRNVVDRLKVVLLMDNGGWSMDPYIHLVQDLFQHAKSQFKDLQTYYFHNTIYNQVWRDPGRYKDPVPLEKFIHADPDTRFILVGDASMAPYELLLSNGSIYAFEHSGRPSIDQLRFLADRFPHTVWLNPIRQEQWRYTKSIEMIKAIFPMFELSLDGLDQAVQKLTQR